MSTRANFQFVAASVTAFLSVWSLGGEASLNLTNRDGLATVKFNWTLHWDTHVPFTPSLLLPRPPPPQLVLLTGHATVDHQRESATSSELQANRKLGMLL